MIAPGNQRFTSFKFFNHEGHKGHYGLGKESPVAFPKSFLGVLRVLCV